MEKLTKTVAIAVMENRGYKDVSFTETGGEIVAINFIKQINDELAIHAKVELKRESVSLYFVGLKYFCQLSAERFAFDHPDFQKYEQIICMYAAKCLEIDVFEVLGQLQAIKPVIESAEEPKPVKKDIKERRREFWDQIVKIGKDRKYPKESCQAFYKYWIQTNAGGIKMQFEITKAKKGVFDVGGRLATWMKNDKEWASGKKDFVEKKIEKQDIEIKKSNSIKKEDLF